MTQAAAVQWKPAAKDSTGTKTKVHVIPALTLTLIPDHKSDSWNHIMALAFLTSVSCVALEQALKYSSSGSDSGNIN